MQILQDYSSLTFGEDLRLDVRNSAPPLESRGSRFMDKTCGCWVELERFRNVGLEATLLMSMSCLGFQSHA